MTRLMITLAAAGALFATTAPAVGSAATVRILDYRFTPKTLHVATGATVTWRWAGQDGHNVTGHSFRSKTRSAGTFTHRFATAGTYRYRCTIHAKSFGMRGTVIVG